MADARTVLDIGSRRWALATAAACLLPLLLQLPARIGVSVALAMLLVSLLSLRKPLPTALRALLALGVLGLVLAGTGFRLGRDTGCALLAAMIAIKPAETFSLRDARSLLGFALFAPFATFLLDQGPTTLVLGMVATLLTLATLQRLADVEAGLAPALGVSLKALWAIGKLLALGLPIAMAVFWLFPRLASPLWGVPDRALARPGLSDRMSPNDWVDLLADETPTLRVRFFGATPRQSQMYWRGPVLWDFDGVTWTQPRELRFLAPPDVRFGTPRFDYQLSVEPTDRRQLVALDLPLAAPDGARLSGDWVLSTAQPLAAVTQWRLQSAVPLSHELQLRPVLRERALALPAGYNPRTLALGRQWRREAGANDAAIVQRALQWIRAEFVYTIDNPRAGRDSIDDFLFRYRAGYCEHFSSAFVVLMRAAGIPARVVTGYAGGYRNPIGDYWLVRRSDAHAWAEVWLPGRGWVRVDPTAAVAPERIYDTLADRQPGANSLLGDLGTGTSLVDVGDWLRRGWNDFVLGFDAQRQQRLLRPLGVDRLDARELGLLFAVASSVALALMLWLSLRTPREADPMLRAWHALGRRYARIGLAREPFEPALAWAERVSLARPEGAGALLLLTRRFSNWRYAPAQADGRQARELLRELRAHRPTRQNDDRAGRA